MPPELIGIATEAVIDTFGVALAGSTASCSGAVAALAEGWGGKPSAALFCGRNLRAAAPAAALANAAAAHALDYDDFGAGTQGHPSAVILPAVFALGQELHASGRGMIEAYILGVEVWAKISGLMPLLHMRGWHPSGVLGTIGAAAAAAKILKLDVEQTTMALGIAGSLASGLLQNFGSATKSIHVGNAAWNGMIAALLARKGCSAAIDVFEGKTGFFAAFGGRNNLDAGDIMLCLGQPYSLISPGLARKRYPACANTHRAIDAMIRLVRTHKISSGDVDAITCYSHPGALKILFHTDPCNTLEAKFSMQYALAVALVKGEFGLSQCSETYLRDPSVRQLMGRVALRVHPDWRDGCDTPQERADKVFVRMKDGVEYSEEVLIPYGDPRNPMSALDLLKKYRECARTVLTDGEAEQRLAVYRNIASVADVSTVV